MTPLKGPGILTREVALESTTPFNNAEQVIATVNTRRLIRWLLRPLLAAAGLLAVVAIKPLLDQLLPHAAGRLERVHNMLPPIAVGWAVLTILLAARQALERKMVLRGEFLEWRGSSFRISAVALSNITEVHVRLVANWWTFGTDRGIGMVLARPRIHTWFGVSRLSPRLNYLTVKCHGLAPHFYNEPIEQIAFAVADAAGRARGQAIPVRIVTRQGTHLPFARPIAPLETPTARPAPFIAEIVLAGVDCIECGYDLRMLPRTGVCPECGTAIPVSLEGTLLRAADPTWLRQLRNGCTLLVVASAMAVVGSLAGSRAFAASQGGLVAGGPDSLIATLMLGASILLGWIGAWVVTPRAPSRTSHAADSRSRRAVRWCVLLPPAFILLAAGRLVPRWTAFFSCIWSGLVVMTVLAWYARELFGRVPSRPWRVLSSIAFAYFMLIVGVLAIVQLPHWLTSVAPSVAGALQPSASAPAPTPTEVSFVVALMTICSASPPLVLGVLFLALRLKLPRMPSRGPSPDAAADTGA